VKKPEKKGYKKTREDLLEKINHDYHIKICFDEIRQKVKPMYQA